MRTRWLDIGSTTGAAGAALASAAASVCCIGPLALTLLGVQGMIIAAGIKPYRFHLLAASLILLGFAHWAVRRRERAIAAGACDIKVGRWTRPILWSATVLWFIALAVQFAANLYVV